MSKNTSKLSDPSLSPSELAKKDYFSKDIINLEFLEYTAYKLSNIYHYKDYVTFFPSIQKQMKNIRRWKVLRNIVLVLLYISLIFTKPDWCDKMELDITRDCSRNKTDDIDFFTITPYYLDLYNFEIISWFFLLVLIIFDLFLVDIKTRVILVFCILYFADILTGFFYMNDVFSIKYNTVIRLTFLVFYAKFTRTTIFTFLKFLYKIRKLYMLYFSIVLAIGVLLNVLYFDIEDDNNDLFFSKLDFSTFANSIYSSYTILTLQNNVNLFSFTISNEPAFIIFLVPIYFVSVFLVLSFVIALMTYFYSKVIRNNIRFINHYSNGFKKIFYFFKDEKGIVDFQQLNYFIKDFFEDPNNIDFEKFEETDEIEKLKKKEQRHKLKDKSHNAIYYKKFTEVRKEFLYRASFISLDTLLTILPIIIMNTFTVTLKVNWYFNCIIISATSCIDPFLILTFQIHKITAERRKLNYFKIGSSIFIIIFSLILLTQSSLSIAETNHKIFILFSIFCFFKIVTILDEILMKSHILYNIMLLCKQLFPFFLKIITLWFIFLIFYSLIGRMLFGGLMNSSSIDMYESTGFTIRDKYEYFNFNDIISSFLTLFVLIMQNNWIYVTEHMYFVRNDLSTTIFIVSFNIFVQFTLTSLVLGCISKLIILYFERDFKDLKNNLDKMAYSENLSKSVEVKELDEYD